MRHSQSIQSQILGTLDYADGTHEYPGEGDDGQSLTEHEEHEQHGQHPAHQGAVYVVTWDTCSRMNTFSQ